MQWTVMESIFKVLILTTSPKFRKMLEKIIRDLYIFAQNTPNPWDDYFVNFIADLLQVDLQKKINPYTELKEE